MKLPSALAPWQELLSFFPPELAQALGTLVRQLAPLVGPPLRESLSEGDPDGLGDLSRRGPYERLLASEWLLADEVPDEFLRRAAANEHLFLSPAQRRRGTSDACTVLFDIGPMQLGAPRVGQLAVLMLLAQRARDAGIPFTFGALQHPDDWCAEVVTKATVLSLLRTRSTQMPTAVAERLAKFDPHHEVWLVGHPESFEDVETASVIMLDEVIDPARRELSVRVRQSRRPPLSRHLELPAEEVCLKLLRRPFEESHGAVTPAVSGKKVVLAKDAPLRLSANGRRVLTRTDDGRPVALHLTPSGQPGKPKRLHPPEGFELMATTFRGDRWGALWSFQGRLYATGFQKGNGTIKLGTHGAAQLPDPHRFVPGRLWRDDDGTFAFVDAEETLFTVREDDEEARPVGRVLADAPCRFGVGAIHLTANEEVKRYGGKVLSTRPRAPEEVLLNANAVTVGGFVKGDAGWALPGLPPLKIGDSTPFAFRVEPFKRNWCALLCLDERRTRVLHETPQGMRLVVDLEEPVTSATAALDWPLAAVLTRSGRLVAFDWNGRLVHDERFEVAS